MKKFLLKAWENFKADGGGRDHFYERLGYQVFAFLFFSFLFFLITIVTHIHHTIITFFEFDFYHPLGLVTYLGLFPITTSILLVVLFLLFLWKYDYFFKGKRVKVILLVIFILGAIGGHHLYDKRFTELLGSPQRHDYLLKTFGKRGDPCRRIHEGLSYRDVSDLYDVTIDQDEKGLRIRNQERFFYPDHLSTFIVQFNEGRKKVIAVNCSQFYAN